MKRDGDRFLVYDIEGELVGEMTVENQKERWPEGVKGWKHALDCSVEPYDERSLAENLAFAAHVHKHNIVVKPEDPKAPEETLGEAEAEEPGVDPEAVV